MRHIFNFGGAVSSDYGVYISGSGVFDAPERNYEDIEIPGRNGSLLGLEKSLGNIELVYPAFVYKNLKTNAARLKSALMSKIGYQRLTDTYYPEEYRLAYYRGGLEAETVDNLSGANFEIVFTCKPQRYLVSGGAPTSYTASGTILNPTDFDAAPLIRVYGSGTVNVGGNVITIDTEENYVDIDCEMMECYYGNQLKNNEVSFTGNDFPILHPGVTSIIPGGEVTEVQITPRWWRL